MEDSNLTDVTLPTQIGKIGLHIPSCWAQILGPTSHPDGGSYGMGKVAAFCVKNEDVYTFGEDRHLYRNDERSDIMEPGDGVFLMRVVGDTIYLWCHNLSLYTLRMPLMHGAVPTPVPGWDTQSLLPTPVAMAIGLSGWLLTHNGTESCLSTWRVAEGGGSLVNVSLAGSQDLGMLTALALVGDVPYIANASNIYRLGQAGTAFNTHHVLSIPPNWNGISGMLGQKVLYNDPMPTSATSQAFASYLYVAASDGEIRLVYADSGKYAGTGARAEGDEACGNLQLGSQGLLYYVQSPITGGISTVNVLDATEIYLDQAGPAGNGITLLPNLLMSLPSEDSTVSINFYSSPDKVDPIGTVILFASDSPYVRDGYRYDKTIQQSRDGQPTAVIITNPYGLPGGPAVVLEFVQDNEGDGNLILGDLIVDPHTSNPVHPHIHP